jgi:hypothetical protein
MNVQMDINNMNSMPMYNNIQYQTITSRRSFDTFTHNLSKSINSNNVSSVNVNDRNFFM